jgi:hypothetical protein
MKKEIRKFTREWFVEQGRIGGLKTKEKYGTNHYSKIRPDKPRLGKKLTTPLTKKKWSDKIDSDE